MPGILFISTVLFMGYMLPVHTSAAQYTCAIKGGRQDAYVVVTDYDRDGNPMRQRGERFQGVIKKNQKQEIKSLWFSYELTPRQFIERFPDLPFFVLPLKLKAYALDWLQDRILEALTKYGIEVVFIDHLHFLFDMARSASASIEIGQIIRWRGGPCPISGPRQGADDHPLVTRRTWPLSGPFAAAPEQLGRRAARRRAVPPNFRREVARSCTTGRA